MMRGAKRMEGSRKAAFSLLFLFLFVAFRSLSAQTASRGVEKDQAVNPRIPDVRQQTLQAAENRLSQLGYRAGTITYVKGNAAPMWVISQDPPPGTPAPLNFPVNLTVVKNPVTQAAERRRPVPQAEAAIGRNGGNGSSPVSSGRAALYIFLVITFLYLLLTIPRIMKMRESSSDPGLRSSVSQKRRGGFSFLEVSVAITLLALGILFFVELYSGLISITFKKGGIYQVENVSRDLMEILDNEVQTLNVVDENGNTLFYSANPSTDLSSGLRACSLSNVYDVFYKLFLSSVTQNKPFDTRNYLPGTDYFTAYFGSTNSSQSIFIQSVNPFNHWVDEVLALPGGFAILSGNYYQIGSNEQMTPVPAATVEAYLTQGGSSPSPDPRASHFFYQVVLSIYWTDARSGKTMVYTAAPIFGQPFWAESNKKII